MWSLHGFDPSGLCGQNVVSFLGSELCQARRPPCWDEETAGQEEMHEQWLPVVFPWPMLNRTAPVAGQVVPRKRMAEASNH